MQAAGRLSSIQQSLKNELEWCALQGLNLRFKPPRLDSPKPQSNKALRHGLTSALL
jgi:hypothetical protein